MGSSRFPWIIYIYFPPKKNMWGKNNLLGGFLGILWMTAGSVFCGEARRRSFLHICPKEISSWAEEMSPFLWPAPLSPFLLTPWVKCYPPVDGTNPEETLDSMQHALHWCRYNENNILALSGLSSGRFCACAKSRPPFASHLVSGHQWL